MPKIPQTARHNANRLSKLHLKKKIVLGKTSSDLPKASLETRIFGQVLDTTPFHLASINKDGYYTSWNKASEEMFGYTKEEAIGKLKPSVFHRIEEEARMVIEKALKDGGFHDEAVLVKKNGEQFPVLLDVKVLRDKKGYVSGFLGSAIDLTKQKQMEQREKTSEDKYRQVFENSIDAILYIDSKGIILDANKACQEITGYNLDEFISHSVYSLPFLQIKKYEYLIPTFIREKRIPTFELELIHKNGQKKVVEMNVSSSELKTFQVIIRDITERKQAEDALRHSENMYRAIFENTGNATIIVEEDMTITYANSEFANFAGYTKDEILNKMKWFNFFAEEDVKKMKEYHNLRRIKPASAPRNYEAHFISREGVIKNVFLTVAMIPGTKKSVASILDITPLKAVENELRASKKLFDDLVHSSPTAIFAVNMQHKVIYWNKAIEKMTGLKASRMIGTSNHWMPFYREPTQQITDMIIDRVKWSDIVNIDRYKDMEIEEADMKEGIVCSKFFEHCRSGKKKWLRFKIKPLYDPQDRLVGAIETVEDITERKQMNKLLENRMREFQVLYQVNSRIRMVDPLKQVLGRIVKDLVLSCDEIRQARVRITFDGKTYTNLKKDEDFVRKIEEPISVLGRKRGNIELGYIQKIENKLSFSLKHEKKVIYIVATTLGKHVQHREILKRYQKLVTKSVVGIFILQDGVFKYINPKLSRIFKLNEKEIIGMPYEKFIPDCTCHLKFKLNNKLTSSHCIAKTVQKDGAAINLEIFTQQISYYGKSAILGTVQDVTKVKEAQDRQKNFNNELKLKIAERTKDLQRANRRLRSLNELKDEFIAVTSHELRSPLTAIRGYISFLVDKGMLSKIPDDARDYLARVYDNVEVLNNLVNNILDVSRIEMDRLQLHRQPTDIADLIQKVIDNMSFQANEKKLSINFINKLEKGVLMLQVDQVRMRQVIRNIMDNAIKFSPEGRKIDIEIEMRGIGAQISISDQGMGIRKSEVFDIFDKFKQAKNSNTQYNKGGAGLGLFIAKKIVELHDGMIWVESTVRKGAVFRIQLPFD